MLPRKNDDGPSGAAVFYVAALIGIAVSVDTTWRFFGEVLHIDNVVERAIMFSGMEVALVACGYAMRANVRKTGEPGRVRVFAWALAGFSAFIAWQLSGVAAGLARVGFGPVLAITALHFALGIEIRHRNPHRRSTTWARVGEELRERVLSRMGLSDDGRTALAMTRDRASRRVARLAVAGRLVPFRRARLSRALRVSAVAHDVEARGRMLAELAVLRHADKLSGLDQASPWDGTGEDSVSRAVSGQHVPRGGTGRTVPRRLVPVRDSAAGQGQIEGRVVPPDGTPPDGTPPDGTPLDGAATDAERVRLAMGVVGASISDVVAYLEAHRQEVRVETVRKNIRRALQAGMVVDEPSKLG